MARLDYGQVPVVKHPKLKGMWLISSYGSLKKSKEDFTDLKYIDNKFINSANRNTPGISLVGIKKSSGQWGIIKIWEAVI